MKFQLMFMKEYIEIDFSAHNQTGTLFMINEKLDTLSGIHYPEDYKNALMMLRKAARNNDIACTEKEVVAGRKGFWTFLRPIKFVLPNVIKTDTGFTVEYDISFADNLGVYISDCCSGDVEVAINRIDQITRSVSNEVVSTGKYELLLDLQQMGKFLRDVSIVVTKYKIRADRDECQDSQSSTRFSYRVACMLCAQPIVSPGHNRCLQHTRSRPVEKLDKAEADNRDNSIRRMQRIVINSYINLKLYTKYIPSINDLEIEGMSNEELMKELAPLIKKQSISRNKASDERCELLEGWSRRQSIQQCFRREVKLIEECLEIVISAGELTLADLELYFGSIIKTVRSFEHTRALLTEDKNSSFYFDLSLTSIENAARIVQGRVKIDCNLSKKELQLVTYTLIREAQFCLIRKASTVKNLPVIESWHTKYLAMSLKFDY
ncbi:hypothetical protein L1D44_07010 [Shewanella sp. Isolate13]|uniref:hypothetical protein n=1 Tax=Shewanella sp. Isolate13 TaxID=2908531 RepID=UPI001EFE5E1E|nr:hypothetical protein [Shewanella sp. Isolate13]MCG9729600.1 hypothetical protein [Shewanella sp. Isolate13]